MRCAHSNTCRYDSAATGRELQWRRVHTEGRREVLVPVGIVAASRSELGVLAVRQG